MSQRVVEQDFTIPAARCMWDKGGASLEPRLSFILITLDLARQRYGVETGEDGSSPLFTFEFSLYPTVLSGRPVGRVGGGTARRVVSRYGVPYSWPEPRETRHHRCQKGSSCQRYACRGPGLYRFEAIKSQKQLFSVSYCCVFDFESLDSSQRCEGRVTVQVGVVVSHVRVEGLRAVCRRYAVNPDHVVRVTRSSSRCE